MQGFIETLARPQSADAMLAQMKARHAQEAAELADQVDGLQSMRDGFTGKADQIRALQNEGYAPLMRRAVHRGCGEVRRERRAGDRR